MSPFPIIINANGILPDNEMNSWKEAGEHKSTDMGRWLAVEYDSIKFFQIYFIFSTPEIAI